MAQTVILHVQNEDPIIAEMESLPGATDTLITITNPRRRDGKALAHITEGSVAYLYPVSRITFIEVMAPPTEESDIVAFFR